MHPLNLCILHVFSTAVQYSCLQFQRLRNILLQSDNIKYSSCKHLYCTAVPKTCSMHRFSGHSNTYLHFYTCQQHCLSGVVWNSHPFATCLMYWLLPYWLQQKCAVQNVMTTNNNMVSILQIVRPTHSSLLCYSACICSGASSLIVLLLNCIVDRCSCVSCQWCSEWAFAVHSCLWHRLKILVWFVRIVSTSWNV